MTGGIQFLLKLSYMMPLHLQYNTAFNVTLPVWPLLYHAHLMHYLYSLTHLHAQNSTQGKYFFQYRQRRYITSCIPRDVFE